ncbi:helix-hairpin-helix domain-containing protein [Deinococcus maricopensis]|uniref:PHP domain protein n=1 Tax=Deinococcus maricopensis (strain DSM 21211 / LMG 22137 / NRRL B-23946 / LB-34) TaxID=709986 RepID=E8U706_DEIML|nr:helix-hairpin-helix domain-containing protein [Deinococcus maricopensis]ADV66845.1 PHP domain protein [Deinococcus maricopensis DSM 21211]
MDKKQVLGVLEATAEVLELLGESEFRVRAYRGAVRGLEATEEDWAALLASGFAGVRGVGPGTRAELQALAETGVFMPFEEAAALIPPGVLTLLRVRGLGPKKVRALWDAGIDSLEALREAARDGRLAALKGFGAKTAVKLLEGAEFALAMQARQHLSVGVRIVETLTEALAGLEPRAAGGVRRAAETIEDAQVTVTGTAEAVRARLTGLLSDVADHPDLPALTGRLDGVPVEVGYAASDARGALDVLYGGGRVFREKLVQDAARQGFALTATGLRRGDALTPTPAEADVFATLGRTCPPAEYREPEHEGLLDALPGAEALITVRDIRGMLHTHSTWSDGTAGIREMAEEAVRRGHAFLGTGDHSVSAHYANGLSIARLREQLREVRELQRAGVPLVAGSEVDILEDGTLDFPDDVLAELDYVVASVHSRFDLPADAQTARIVRAAQHPLVTILGHPTGRLLVRRPGYALDLDAVMAACAAAGTVVEINASPYRLDVDWRVALAWRGRVRFAINTDAHVPAGLGDARYGVMVARKAGLTPEDVVNSLDREAFLAFVAQQRAAR